MTPSVDTAAAPERVSATELSDVWPLLSTDERVEGFRLLEPSQATRFFLGLRAHDQAELLVALPPEERPLWMRLLAPDDAVDVVQAAPEAARQDLLRSLDERSRHEVTALLAYAEDVAGGLMSPRFVRLRPDMRVDEAITYLRRQVRERVETVYYVYVLDAAQHLRGVLSFRELFAAPTERRVSDLMHRVPVTAPLDMDQEQLAHLFAEHDLLAIPVVDAEGRMQGIVTVDDIVDVVREEATEDIHKIGGSEALDVPYLQSGLGTMVRKRAPWLVLLFLGETFTANAIARFEHHLASAVVLALFIPLIIASGGNSGSQATTLVIRALALRELRLRDFWRVARRELATGLLLGSMLGLIGLLRVIVWQALFHSYGPHYLELGLTVAASLLGVVVLGTLAGSMLPLLLRRVRLDPATASAPLVATLVDVTGLLIYFSVASVILRSTLLR